MDSNESEEKFSKIFRACPDSITFAELETGRFLDVNAGFERLFGYRRDEVVGRTSHEIGIWAHPEDRADMAAALKQHGSVRDFRTFVRRRDGAIRLCMFSAELVEFANVPSIIIVARDITESMEADRALRDSEEKFSKAFRATPDAITISDLATGRIIEFNDGFLRMHGFRREEVTGRTPRELGLWDDPADRERLIALLHAQGSVRDFEARSRTRGGAEIQVLLSADILDLGDKLCYLTVVRDITERRKAEAERLQAAAREREARDDFTRRLIASQEAERRRIANELHDSLGQNLLLIKNRSLMALSAPNLQAGLQGQIEGIRDLAGETIAEAQQISRDLRPFLLDQLGLTEALKAVVAGAEKSTGLRFEAKVDNVDDLFPPESATNLYRIVQEALNNVVKHARARRVVLALERDIHQVRLHLEDDGLGFEPGGAVPAGSPGGMGLGNMAERARILGGSLAIDSRPGAGTCLEVLIPVQAEI